MNLDSPVLIGGAGSSGTTLLAAILDSHPWIVCGPEMSFFNKRVIYGDYSRFQKRLRKWLEKGFPTDGYVLYPRFLAGREYYGLEDTRLLGWANGAQTLHRFVELLQTHILEEKGKTQFVEKTGSNAYCFREFVNIFPRTRIIHLARDGRDVVCSLMRRGMTLFRASSHWLYNTSAALACRHLPQYLEIRYEDLVTNPTGVIQRVCAHIEAEFVPRMLNRDRGEVPQSGLQTWRSSPTGPITSKSVGQYKEQLSEFQLSCFYHVCLTNRAAEQLGMSKSVNTVDILSSLGYSVPPRSWNGYPLKAVPEVIADQLRRNKRSLRGGWGARRPLTWVQL